MDDRISDDIIDDVSLRRTKKILFSIEKNNEPHFLSAKCNYKNTKSLGNGRPLGKIHRKKCPEWNISIGFFLISFTCTW